MYDIISEIINHVYNTQYTGEQQIIYYICGAVICILVACFIDLIYRIIGHFWR